MKRLFIMSLLFASLGACSTSDPEQKDVLGERREAAITRALANPELQHYSAALRDMGWVVAAGAQANVEWLDVPADMASDAASSAPSATMTRVRIAVTRPTTSLKPELTAELVLAWTDGGPDIFALAPRSELAGKELSSAVEAVANLDAGRNDSLLAGGPAPAAAASCGAENAACGGVTTCCRGLVCTEPRDNHFVCSCTNPFTSSYPQQATTSMACFALPENPIGAAKIQRNISGCGCCDLGADACGNAVSLPQYVRSSSTQLICLFTPGPIC